MRTPLIRHSVLAALLLLAGCHSVYFYETDKISLTVEVRPDSTGPIQGNFGLKQRVVAFVPPRADAKRMERSPEPPAAPARGDLFGKTADTAAPAPPPAPSTDGVAPPSHLDSIQRLRSELAKAADPAGDAMSVLSSMRFHKLPKPDGAPWYKVSHMTIDSALITGAAAKAVAKPGQAIAALSGQSILTGLNRVSALRGMYTALKDARARDDRAAELVRGLDDLAPALVPPTYPVPTYNWANPERTKLETDTKEGANVPRATFGDVLSYWAAMDDTAAILGKLPTDFTVDNQPITGDRRATLATQAAKAAEESQRLEQATREQKAVRDAAEFFAKIL